VLEAAFDVHGSELFADGLVMPQARSSMVVTRILAPEPGDRVLDLCAAPGAKTTHVAAMVGDGSVVAVERHARRADALRRTCRDMGATNVEIRTGDAISEHAGAPFDRVLVDPPCSGLGTLQSRPDLRWHRDPDAISELTRLQGEILVAGADATGPGGVLVYSVCTISRREGEGVVEAFAAARPDFEVESTRQLLPHRDGTDGFWIARLRRTR
jgi:16S rRNA (cytosine967-C5)-methyltransferase